MAVAGFVGQVYIMVSGFRFQPPFVTYNYVTLLKQVFFFWRGVLDRGKITPFIIIFYSLLSKSTCRCLGLG